MDYERGENTPDCSRKENRSRDRQCSWGKVSLEQRLLWILVLFWAEYEILLGSVEGQPHEKASGEERTVLARAVLAQG